MENVKERYEELAQMSFNSKATYLAWVVEWKWFYVLLSRHIRETRAEIKELQRSLILILDQESWLVCRRKFWEMLRKLDVAKHYATVALLLRRHSKKEAAFQAMTVMTHDVISDAQSAVQVHVARS